ncbi:MAG: hypothetical protein LUO79_02950, partial [Methanomassiliicoccales archaeon]|nr:hypothetical protein [Methanomassiliicoccales archaeon]
MSFAESVGRVGFKKLSQQNPENKPKEWKRIRLLYKGGYELKEQAKQFIEKAINETQQTYEYRIKRVSYINYFGQVIDYLVAALFEEELSITAAGDAKDPNTPGELPDKVFWPEFANDADRAGSPFSEVMRRIVTQALLFKRGVLYLDFPPVSTEITNRAQEEKTGAGRGYCWDEGLDQQELLDWRLGDDGKWLWAITMRTLIERINPWDERTHYKCRFKCWYMEGGVAKFVVLESKLTKIGEPIGDEELMSPVEEGTTSFRRIPIVVLELPDGLWAGNKIGSLAEEHFQRRSDLFGAIGRNLVEIPWYRQGSEIRGVGEALPSAPGEDERRGEKTLQALLEKGIVPIGDKDEIGYASPSGNAFSIADKSLQSLKEEIYLTVTAMALSLPNTAATVGRSGESKKEDSSSAEKVLGALGKFVRRASKEVYDCFSDARRESVVWSVYGCSKFRLNERGELVDEALTVETIPIPSQTFQKEYKTSLALSLVPHCSPETRVQIQKEIDQGIDENQAMTDALREAALRANEEGTEEEDTEEDEELEEEKPPNAAEGTERGNQKAPAGSAQ